jgi:hypothetical protein
MTTPNKLSFSIVPDRDWDYLKFVGIPAGHKFDEKTRQALADNQIYFSFKRSMYYRKSRIDASVVQKCLKGHSFLPMKGTQGYVAPVSPKKSSDKGKTLESMTKAELITMLKKLVA